MVVRTKAAVQLKTADKTAHVTKTAPKQTARTKQTARLSAGGKAPRLQMAVKTAKKMREPSEVKKSDEEEEEEDEEEDEEEPEEAETETEEESEEEPGLRPIPIQTLKKINRMKAGLLREYLTAYQANPERAFRPMLITRTEVNAYLTRILKLRIARADEDLLAAKTAMLDMLRRLGHRLDRGFRKETDEENKNAIRRLRTIDAEETEEFRKRSQMEWGLEEEEEEEEDDEEDEFSIYDPFFDLYAIDLVFGDELISSGQRDKIVAMIQERLHNWLQSVFNYLPIVATPNRGISANAANSSCASDKLDAKILFAAIKIENPTFANRFRMMLDDFKRSMPDVPTPIKAALLRAMKFYMAPITTVPNNTYALMSDALTARMILLVKGIRDQANDKEIGVTVCDEKKTEAGRIPHKNSSTQNFKGSAVNMNAFGVQLAIDDSDEYDDEGDEDEGDDNEEDEEDDVDAYENWF